MSILHGLIFKKKYQTDSNGDHKLVSQWTSSYSVELKNGHSLQEVLGNVDLSSIGDGTVTGIIEHLENDKSDKIHTKLTGTLIVGQTSLIINDSAIKTDSYFDIYTSIYGVNPKSISVVDGTILLEFDTQIEDMEVAVVIGGY